MPKKMYRKKRTYAKKGTKLNIRQKKEVKQIVNGSVELKTFDEGGAPTVSSTPTVSAQMQIPQGVNQSQRVGNDITASHLQIKYQLQNDTLVGNDASNTIRIIYFQWREDDTVNIPTVNDILYRPNTSVPWVNALYHFDKRESFKILYDRRHEIAFNTSNPVAFGDRSFIKLPHKKISFNVTNGSTGKNKIYCLFVSDSGAVPHPSFVNQARLYYRDA